MLGSIRKRDILAHPLTTINCFGWNVFLKALVAGSNQTFLSLLTETGDFSTHRFEVPELLGRCVEIERTAMRIYRVLADRLKQAPAARAFLRRLSRQEQGHAELLELCREAAVRDGWDDDQFEDCREVVPYLLYQMHHLERSLDSVTDTAGAMRVVVQVETSEINRLFAGVVAASQSPFVEKLGVFHRAGRRHIAFLCQHLPKLEPDLDDVCGQLRKASSLV